jgi:alpha-beta hydrolase superfamily lysophospholipase
VCDLQNVHASAVQAPTLLIHADEDTALLDAVQTLDRELATKHKLVRIAHTNRLFNNASSMDNMVNATVQWLAEQLFNELPVVQGLDDSAMNGQRTQAASA